MRIEWLGTFQSSAILLIKDVPGKILVTIKLNETIDSVTFSHGLIIY